MGGERQWQKFCIITTSGVYMSGLQCQHIAFRFFVCMNGKLVYYWGVGTCSAGDESLEVLEMLG
jgi:hypothetical protein